MAITGTTLEARVGDANGKKQIPIARKTDGMLLFDNAFLYHARCEIGGVTELLVINDELDAIGCKGGRSMRLTGKEQVQNFLESYGDEYTILSPQTAGSERNYLLPI